MFKPVEVKASSDYKIWVRYADGVEGEVDLSHLAGRVSSQGQVKKIEFPMKKVDCEAQR